MRIFTLFLLIWLCGAGKFALAQNQNFGFHFKNPKRTKMRVPFQQHNNLIVVSLFLDSQYDTLNFVLDTGVSYTLITDPAVRKRFSLSCNRTIKIAGAGKEELVNGCVTRLEYLRFNKHLLAYQHPVIILEKDILELSAHAGIKIHGLLGYEFFSRFVVEIDYRSRMLLVTRPDVFVPKITKKTQEIPLLIEDMKPYLYADTHIGQDTAQLKYLLDTGAGHSLSLDCGTHPIIKLPEKHLPARLGMTLNGAIEGAIGRIEQLKLGKWAMKKVITTFPDSVSVNKRVQIGGADRHGNIGCGILSRFNLVFDYPHQKLYLKPNAKFKEPFEFNTSGIELTASPPYYLEVKIGGIRPNSPAARMGLQIGDKIIAIDNVLTRNKRLGEIYHSLNQREGRRVTLLVELVEGGFQVVELRMENPL